MWKERNNRIFRDQDTNERIIFNKILNALTKNQSISKESGALHRSKVKNRREDCRWTIPPEGWCKENFYGAANGNPGKVGVAES